jgi:DNA-binding response OmpR family regulator
MMAIKILSVDDEPIVYRIIEATIGVDPRFALSGVADGDQAILTVQRDRPDIILLGVDLPGENGFEVCRAVKADPDTSAAVLVMLTAMAQPADKQSGVDSGADYYLPKPFSPAALMMRLDSIAAQMNAA